MGNAYWGQRSQRNAGRRKSFLRLGSYKPLGQLADWIQGRITADLEELPQPPMWEPQEKARPQAEGGTIDFSTLSRFINMQVGGVLFDAAFQSDDLVNWNEESPITQNTAAEQSTVSQPLSTAERSAVEKHPVPAPAASGVAAQDKPRRPGRPPNSKDRKTLAWKGRWQKDAILGKKFFSCPYPNGADGKRKPP